MRLAYGGIYLAEVPCVTALAGIYLAVSNVPYNFSKSVCTYNFHCATFYQDSSVIGTTCMKYAQKHFWKEHNFMSALSFLVCARLEAHGVRARMRTA